MIRLLLYMEIHRHAHIYLASIDLTTQGVHCLRRGEHYLCQDCIVLSFKQKIIGYVEDHNALGKRRSFTSSWSTVDSSSAVVYKLVLTFAVGCADNLA